jgi:hypothetical protein
MSIAVGAKKPINIRTDNLSSCQEITNSNNGPTYKVVTNDDLIR